MKRINKALTKKKCSKCGNNLTFQVSVDNGITSTKLYCEKCNALLPNLVSLNKNRQSNSYTEVL